MEMVVEMVKARQVCVFLNSYFACLRHIRYNVKLRGCMQLSCEVNTGHLVLIRAINFAS